MTDLKVTFLVHSAEGHVVAGDLVHDDSLSAFGPGEMALSYTVPKLQLLPGAFHLSASVSDRHSDHVYDSSPNIASLSVLPRGHAFELPGYVPLEGRWSVDG
jgi:hypothetical protein